MRIFWQLQDGVAQTPLSSTLIRLSSWLSEFRRLREAYHLFRWLNYWTKRLNLYLYSVAKDLGLIIDSSLSCTEHVTKTVSDCMHRLISINRIKHLDRKTLLLLINAFVFSKLFYCSIVWSNTSKTNNIAISSWSLEVWSHLWGIELT